jgi:lipopolysaccharide/colanic/teichoic acid biosynthesis glycosyltransferase
MKKAYHLFKRTFDIIIALLGLIVLGLIFIPIMIAIKSDTRGPAIFGQPRVGQRGKVFQCYKFRTMYTVKSENKNKPSTSDDRVTRVGRILRRWSIDELPQLWNILRGEMSLVGPRPELVDIVSGYEAWQLRRFEVKPGLTGWWQVNGRKQPMYANINEDIYYVDHQSISLDLLIFLRTFIAIISGKGAL